nr:uncharacterized protein [Tanacetum cinerariifolium]
MDFLNGSSIKYALMMNPNIYVSCIKQFWTTVTVKQVNDVTRLQALVDKKKVVITEATIRDALRLDDAEGVDCLPNEEIFTELARMGYEKPSTKLTFYKAFFSSQWKVGKGFSRVETPLFEGMLVEQEIDKEGDTDEHVEEVKISDAAHEDDSAAHREVPTVTEEPSIPSPTLPTPPPQPAQDIPSTSQVQQTPPQSPQEGEETGEEEQGESVEAKKGRMIAEMDQDDAVVLEDDKEEDKEVTNAVKDVEEAKEDETEPAKVQEVVDVVTTAKLITEVVTAASETLTAASAIITTTEAQVPAATLTAAPARVAAAPSKRRKGVVIRDTEEESTTSTIILAETKSKDKGKWILVEEPKPLKKKQQIEQDEQYARELHAELNKDIDWDEAINHVKRKAKEDPVVKKYQDMKKKPQTEAQARKNMMMYLNNVEDENRALQKINETLAERAAKRRKLDEEVEDLKRHHQIVPNEDDAIYTEATPLTGKVLVVDYEIIEMNNKPYYQIIRVDEESKKCTWSSKGQELEANGIMWCADHNFYNHTANFVSGTETKLRLLNVKCCCWNNNEEITNTVENFLKNCRDSYEDGIDLKDKAFMKMMVLLNSKRALLNGFRRDMVKLDNQIPMFILIALFAFENGESKEISTNELLEMRIRFFVPSVRVRVDENSQEHLQRSMRNNVIDSAEGLGFLHYEGIIEHWLVNDTDITDLFNELCQQVVADHDGSYLSGLTDSINKRRDN